MDVSNQRPAWLEIDISAIRKNFRSIKSLTGDVGLCAIVKANAYAHGSVRIAELAAEEGCRMLAVATCVEAMELRSAGCRLPILCLSPIGMEQISMALHYDVAITVFSMQMARAISAEALRMGKEATIHVAVDTGMSRIGIRADESGLALAKAIAALPGLRCEGLYTHFSNADSSDRSYTEQQIARFEGFRTALKKEGVEFEICHTCNSGGIIGFPEAYYDMVRPGIILYGCYPSDDVNKKALPLFPALSVKAQVTLVKNIAAGTAVSYGCKYIAPSARRIATLPVGYADGVPYAYGAAGEVLICGKRAPIVGTVCMDQFMVDVTDIPDCQVGSEAVLIGSQEEECITLEEMAAKCHTIKYEILTGFNSRLREKYVGE